jgi:hypothetical protein
MYACYYYFSTKRGAKKTLFSGVQIYSDPASKLSLHNRLFYFSSALINQPLYPYLEILYIVLKDIKRKRAIQSSKIEANFKPLSKVSIDLSAQCS